MPVVGRTISQEEPVHFRINSFDPNPLQPPFSRPGERLLAVHVDTPHRRDHVNFPLLPAEFEPYLDAIQEAIRTQDLYWVDWNFENRDLGQPTDTTYRRVLQALQARQLVSAEENA